MNRILLTSLYGTSALALAMATEGTAGGPPVTEISGEPAFIVHAMEAEGTIALDKNGRVITALNERPEWAHGLAVAMLHERTKYYTDRLGPEGSAEHLAMNTINVEDLAWVAFDEQGDEVEVEAHAEFRAQTLAMALGVNDEGEIHGAIAERVIAGDTKNWSEEMAHQDPNAMPATKTGTAG